MNFFQKTRNAKYLGLKPKIHFKNHISPHHTFSLPYALSLSLANPLADHLLSTFFTFNGLKPLSKTSTPPPKPSITYRSRHFQLQQPRFMVSPASTFLTKRKSWQLRHCLVIFNSCMSSLDCVQPQIEPPFVGESLENNPITLLVSTKGQKPPSPFYKQG